MDDNLQFNKEERRPNAPSGSSRYNWRSPQRVRGVRIVPSPHAQLIVTSQHPPQKRQCNCKKSGCLKLYCECFAAGVYCDGSLCNCVKCCNNLASEHVRKEAVETVLAKNPMAFRPKIGKSSDTYSKAMMEMGSHFRGCHCKKSGCLKKYCECFQAGIICSDRCKCQDCKNVPGVGRPLMGQNGQGRGIPPASSGTSALLAAAGMGMGVGGAGDGAGSAGYPQKSDAAGVSVGGGRNTSPSGVGGSAGEHLSHPYAHLQGGGAEDGPGSSGSYPLHISRHGPNSAPPTSARRLSAGLQQQQQQPPQACSPPGSYGGGRGGGDGGVGGALPPPLIAKALWRAVCPSSVRAVCSQLRERAAEEGLRPASSKELDELAAICRHRTNVGAGAGVEEEAGGAGEGGVVKRGASDDGDVTQQQRKRTKIEPGLEGAVADRAPPVHSGEVRGEASGGSSAALESGAVASLSSDQERAVLAEFSVILSRLSSSVASANMRPLYSSGGSPPRSSHQ